MQVQDRGSWRNMWTDSGLEAHSLMACLGRDVTTVKHDKFWALVSRGMIKGGYREHDHVTWRCGHRL